MKRCLTLVTGLAGFALVSCTDTAPMEDKKPADSFPAFDIANLDTSVAPCADFFQYAAGGFIEKNPVPESESRWGQFNLLREANNEKVKVILEEFSGKADLKKGSDAQLIGDFFYSGMDSAAIEEGGLKYAQPYLDQIQAVEDLNGYFTLAAKNRLIGLSNPFVAYVSPDQKNAKMNVLYTSQSGLSMPDRDYYLKDDSASVAIQQEFMAYVVKTLQLAGSTEEEAAADQAKRIYALEKQLAENSMSRVDRRNPKLTYNKMSLAELQESTPNIQWSAYLSGIGIETDSLIVGQPDYLKNLSDMYANVSLDDWKLYMHWHALRSFSGYLPAAFQEASFAFYGTTLRGTKVMKPRWKRVLNAMGGLNEQMGHLFVDKHFSPESKERVSQMVEDLRSVYRERIRELSWMSPETKEKALEKLNAFTYKIGYPDNWKDFSDLEIARESYLMNDLALTEYVTKERLSRMNKPVDKSEWFMGAHIVNAYYNPLFNEVVFPAGILQPPFFNPDADDAINYGGIGGVIGHEFTHGFDDKGSLYGADGNLSTWWTDEDRARFDSLVQQVVGQYSAYEVLPGVNINGQLTVGENIADFGGLTLAYHAYQKSREGKEPTADIDGFTDKQRVFLGWAQVWQTAQTDEFTRSQVLTDPHSHPRYRVIGPISNMKEFEEAFGCNSSESLLRKKDDRIVIW